MKNLFISFFLILLFFQLLTGESQSQVVKSDNSNPVTNIFGKISEIKADTKQIQVSVEGGESVTVFIDSQSEFKRISAGDNTLKNATAIGFSEIVVGDNTFVRGFTSGKAAVLGRQIVIITQSDIVRKKEERLIDWKKRGISGIVKNVDISANKILIELKKEASKPLEIVCNSKTIFQRYRTNAKNMEDYQLSGIETIKTGDQIRALGNMTADGNRYDAEEVFSGSFKVISGKVKSIDLETGKFTIVDLKDNRAITVLVNKDSNFKRLTSESMAKYRENGGDASLGSKTKSNTPEAINLTKMLEDATKITVSDIKESEVLVIATTSDFDTGNVIGLTIVSGFDLIFGQRNSSTGQNKKQTFNLDVF